MNPGMKRALMVGAGLIAVTGGVAYFATRNRNVEAAPTAGVAAQSPNIPQDFRPYVALKSLPPPPAQHTEYGKRLTLCKCSEGYCLQDSRHRMYPAGRDRSGHIIPVYRHAGRTIPLRYDTLRDRYY